MPLDGRTDPSLCQWAPLGPTRFPLGTLSLLWASDRHDFHPDVSAYGGASQASNPHGATAGDLVAVMKASFPSPYEWFAVSSRFNGWLSDAGSQGFAVALQSLARPGEGLLLTWAPNPDASIGALEVQIPETIVPDLINETADQFLDPQFAPTP